MPNYIKEIGIQNAGGTFDMYHVNSDLVTYKDLNSKTVDVDAEHKYTVAKYNLSTIGDITVNIQPSPLQLLKNNQEVYVMLVNATRSTLNAQVIVKNPSGVTPYYTGIADADGKFTIEANSTVEVSAICLSNGTTKDYFIRIA